MNFQGKIKVLLLLATLIHESVQYFDSKTTQVEKFRKMDRKRHWKMSSPSSASSVTSSSMKHEVKSLYEDDLPSTSRCKVIPKRFGLCHGMEYNRLRLPNLLGHETMTEVLHQSKVWPPLVSKGCHPETRKFLCSLYAPVCLDIGRSVPPCRSLCESVRDACSPAMLDFGFPWPSILNCTQYPVYKSKQLCIPPNQVSNPNESPAPKTCPPCRQGKLELNIQKKFCHYDFVMRVRFHRLSFERGGTRFSINRRHKKVYRSTTNSKRKLWMPDGLHCSCDVIDSTKHQYLVMGKNVGRNFVIHSISKWNKDTRKYLKKTMKHRCKPS